jgi:hypothetical protein
MDDNNAPEAVTATPVDSVTVHDPRIMDLIERRLNIMCQRIGNFNDCEDCDCGRDEGTLAYDMLDLRNTIDRVWEEVRSLYFGLMRMPGKDPITHPEGILRRMHKSQEHTNELLERNNMLLERLVDATERGEKRKSEKPVEDMDDGCAHKSQTPKLT